VIRVQLYDGQGTATVAGVNPIGGLIVAPYSYDQTEFNELAAVNTAYNFYVPQGDKKFVITGIFFRADKQVSGSADATVVVYEATSDSETTVDKVLMQFAATEGDILTISPLNILVNEGRWVNAKTDDDDIHMTITGYYVPSAAT
jgi:hypothetical protein